MASFADDTNSVFVQIHGRVLDVFGYKDPIEGASALLRAALAATPWDCQRDLLEAFRRELDNVADFFGLPRALQPPSADELAKISSAEAACYQLIHTAVLKELGRDRRVQANAALRYAQEVHPHAYEALYDYELYQTGELPYDPDDQDYGATDRDLDDEYDR